MGKREKKINIIKKYIHNVSSCPTYAYGSIPSSLASNACCSYGGAISKDEIVGLVDTTITGNGKNGLLFTEYKVYFNNGMFGEKGSISYREIANKGTISGSIFSSEYNKQALVELLSSLSNIEGKDFSGTLDDINNEMDNAVDTMNRVFDTLEKGLQILNIFLQEKK